MSDLYQRALNEAQALSDLANKTDQKYRDYTTWYAIDHFEAPTQGEKAIIYIDGGGHTWEIGNAEKYRVFSLIEIVDIFQCEIRDFRPFILDDHVQFGGIRVPMNRRRNPALYLCGTFASGGGWYLAEYTEMDKRFDGYYLALDSIEDMQCALGTPDITPLIEEAKLADGQITIGHRTFKDRGRVSGEVERMISENREIRKQLEDAQAQIMRLTIRLQSRKN
jgi:hypothetical protein